MAGAVWARAWLWGVHAHTPAAQTRLQHATRLQHTHVTQTQVRYDTRAHACMHHSVRSEALGAGPACSWGADLARPAPLAPQGLRGPHRAYLGRCRPASAGRAVPSRVQAAAAPARAAWGTGPRRTRAAGWLWALAGAAHSRSGRLSGPSFCLWTRNGKRVRCRGTHAGPFRKHACEPGLRERCH